MLITCNVPTNTAISLQSVTTGLAYLPQLLQKNKLPAVFDYDEERKTFYLLDKYVKFALKWMPELVDSLFTENQDNS